MGTWVMTARVGQRAHLRGHTRKPECAAHVDRLFRGDVQAHLHSAHSQGEPHRLLPQGACLSCAGALANPVTVHHTCYAH